MSNDRDDAEASYRRGFQQGAAFALKAAEECFKTQAGREKLHHWAHIQIYDWRFGETRGDRNIPAPDAPT